MQLMRGRLALGALLSMGVGVVSWSVSGDALHARQEVETKERLPQEKMKVLVKAPMDIFHAQGLAAGERVFEQLVADARSKRGANSVQVGDLLMSFGLQLYLEWMDDPNEAVRDAAVKYIKASIDVYRHAFGTRHPEVAVALHTYADAAEESEAPIPADMIEAAKREALAIRLAALGETNIETRGTVTSLARTLALRAKSADDQYGAEARALYESAIAMSARYPHNGGGQTVAEIRLSLARLYALDSSPDRALQQAELAKKAIRSHPAGAGLCIRYNGGRERLYKALKANGHEKAAEELEKQGVLQAMIEC